MGERSEGLWDVMVVPETRSSFTPEAEEGEGVDNTRWQLLQLQGGRHLPCLQPQE